MEGDGVATGSTTTLLGEEVAVYREEWGFSVARIWSDPDEAYCQIVVGAEGLTLDEFMRVVDSVAQVEH